MCSIVSKARYGLMAAAPYPSSRREVVHLAGLAGLDDEADLGAGLLADQVVVHRRGGEQHRDRRQVLVRQPVRQDDDVDAVLDGLGDLTPHPLERPPQAVATRRTPG